MIRLVAQPFADMDSLHEEIVDILADNATDRFLVVTAWAKRSGLSRIAADLMAFRGRGGRASMIVGVDEGGATRQGLHLALDLFDRVHVLNDMSGRTFHPKLYLGAGRHALRGYVGSGNLTAGGLYANYELGLSLVLADGDPDYRELRQGLSRYVARLYRDPDTCRRLTRLNIAAVCHDPAYRVGDEDSRRPSPELDASPDSQAEVRGARNVLGFRSSRQEMRRAPAISGRRPATRKLATPQRRRIRSKNVARRIAERWFKRMSASDAQRARAGSNPTGNLRLAQAGHDIDHTTYFRYGLFGGEGWTQETAANGVLDVANIPFEVFIGRKSVGRHHLKILWSGGLTDRID